MWLIDESKRGGFWPQAGQLGFAVQIFMFGFLCETHFCQFLLQRHKWARLRIGTSIFAATITGMVSFGYLCLHIALGDIINFPLITVVLVAYFFFIRSFFMRKSRRAARGS